MNIYSCIDSKNIDKILILFYSILINNKKKEKLKFYLLIDKLENVVIPNFFKDILFIKEFNINEDWKNLMHNFNDTFYIDVPWCKNDMNFARFFIFNHFPEINRAIYLDWDMIVINDISNLKQYYNKIEKIIVSQLEIEQTILNSSFCKNFKYNTNINTLYTNNPTNKLKLHSINKILESLNIKYDQLIKNKSFNAGFFIISKEHLENGKLYTFINILIQFQKTKKCFNFGTQTILNLMDIDKKFFIEKEWNYIPYLKTCDITNKETINTDNINIIHWNGCNKPWTDKKGINKIWWDYKNKFLQITNDN